MEKQVGPETKLKASVVDGKIRLSADYVGKQLGGGAYIDSDSSLLVDALLELIPGNSQFEATMGALLKAALKSVTV